MEQWTKGRGRTGVFAYQTILWFLIHHSSDGIYSIAIILCLIRARLCTCTWDFIQRYDIITHSTLCKPFVIHLVVVCVYGIFGKYCTLIGVASKRGNKNFFFRPHLHGDFFSLCFLTQTSNALQCVFFFAHSLKNDWTLVHAKKWN